MHELMMNCVYLLAIVLSVLGITAAMLILIGMVKGIVGMVGDFVRSNGHGEEND
jgi:hypothetical protein